jgi:hypothetical protein
MSGRNRLAADQGEERGFFRFVTAGPFMPCICISLCSPDYIIAFARGARGGITAITRGFRLSRFHSTSPPSPANHIAEHHVLAFGVAQATGDKLPALAATTFPTSVGSSSSRYTFPNVSIRTWLGIALGLNR